jgi:hypothetical protein
MLGLGVDGAKTSGGAGGGAGLPLRWCACGGLDAERMEDVMEMEESLVELEPGPRLVVGSA